MAESKQGYQSGQGSFNPGGVATVVKDKAKDIASSASDLATQAKDKAQDWASTAADKVGDAKSSMAGGIESLAGTIRNKGPQGGMFGSASSTVADTMEAAGSYLKDADFSEIGQDVTSVIRRYPIQSILVGIGLGFLLARSTRS